MNQLLKVFKTASYRSMINCVSTKFPVINKAKYSVQYFKDYRVSILQRTERIEYYYWLL
jgi:hypothetical protein